MSYVSERLGDMRVLDADSHLLETPDWILGYADPDVRRRISTWNPFTGRNDAFEQALDQMMPGSLPSDLDKKARAQREAEAPERFMIDKNFRVAGAHHPEERPAVIDLMGVEKQMVFSTLSLGQFYAKNIGSDCPWDLDLLYGGATAHNRGMADFCSHDARMIGAGFVPLEDPERSIAGLEEALALGCGAIYVPHAVPEEHSWSHPSYEGFWARLAESGAPLVMHGGSGDKMIGLPAKVYDNGRPTFHVLGDGTWQMADMMTWHWPVQLMLTQLIMDGVFERHPNLRCAVVELRANWVPAFMDSLDQMHYWAYSNPLYPSEYRLPMRASDYIRRQIKFTPWTQGGDQVGRMIDWIEGGERLFMFSSDWPHNEGGHDPIGDFEKELAFLEGRADLKEIRQRFYHDNFAELMGY